MVPARGAVDVNEKRVRIVMPRHGRGEVWLDDERIDGVVRVEFTAGVADAVNHLTLTTIAHPEVVFEGVADVDVVPQPIPARDPDATGPMTEEEVDAIRDRWTRDYTGTAPAGRPTAWRRFLAWLNNAREKHA